MFYEPPATTSSFLARENPWFQVEKSPQYNQSIGVEIQMMKAGCEAKYLHGMWFPAKISAIKALALGSFWEVSAIQKWAF